MEQLPAYAKLPDSPAQRWIVWITSLGADGMDLVKKMLVYDPLKRVTAREVGTGGACHARTLPTPLLNPLPTARQALHHRFFTTGLRPTAPARLPKPSAELRPRALAPEETQDKPAAGAHGLKRAAARPEDGQGLGRNVARRLF